jgi:hypothetical protein
MRAPREDYTDYPITPEEEAARHDAEVRPASDQAAHDQAVRDEEVRTNPAPVMGPRRFATPADHEDARITERSAVMPSIGDVIRWGPVLAGVFFTLAVMIMLTILAFAVQVSTIGALATNGVLTGAGIWSGVAMLVSLFFGSLIAGRTSGLRDAFAGGINGLIVWAVTIFLAIVLSALGAANLLGSVIGGFGIFAGGGTAAANASTTAWVVFGALLISAIVAVLGGVVGAMIAPTRGFRFWRQ